MYAPVATQMGEGWMDKKIELVVNVFLDNATAWDGTAMFSDSRTGGPYGSNTIDNLTTNSLSATNFEAAMVAMSQWKWGNGQHIKARCLCLWRLSGAQGHSRFRNRGQRGGVCRRSSLS